MISEHIEVIIDNFELTAGRIIAPNKQLIGYSISADEWRRMRAALRAAALDINILDSP